MGSASLEPEGTASDSEAEALTFQARRMQKEEKPPLRL